MDNNEQILDQFGRVHDYLRISLTERCNLRCFYCMPEEGVPLRDKAVFMTSEETIEIATRFVALGVKKIRLTGGEPLIKKDIENIITQLSEMPVELTLTTNGILVDKHLGLFLRSGIRKINVSLDSLKPERFNTITRRDYFSRIMNNIKLLMNNGISVSINMVVMKGVNEDEVNDFVEWSREEPVNVRFIEFMPFDGNKWEYDKKVSNEQLLTSIASSFGRDKVETLPLQKNATSRNYRIKNGKGTFGLISTVTNPFCDGCNRIRLTADGKIKNCLFSEGESDLLAALRNGQDIDPIIRHAIYIKKKERGGLDEFSKLDGDKIRNRSMITIGG